ncbi:MAG: hypothetical protein J6U40_00195 [Kiritimatiellae bacterium]|nr:hypothetical protein [Kiritimatiellia bacterium]
MKRFDLNGEWVLRKMDGKQAIPATVPGCVHTDLLAAGRIADPFSGTNLGKPSEFETSAWAYEKSFSFDETETGDRVVLRFEGILPPAKVKLNNRVLGEITRPLVPVEWEVKELLKRGKNLLIVTFPKPEPLPAGTFSQVESLADGRLHPPVQLRGIARGVSLTVYQEARIHSFRITQDFSEEGVAILQAKVICERFNPDAHLELSLRVGYKGNVVSEGRALLEGEETLMTVRVKNPQLWWPAGFGEQPLYKISIDILAGRTSLDHQTCRIGMRRFEFREEKGKGGTYQRYYINGQPIFLKGATWVPSDVFLPRTMRLEFSRFTKACISANMNCFRVWGGGVYECDAFYDLCDEYGICLLQDALLTENLHAEKPTADQLEAFKEGFVSVIQRARNHACFLGWVGGDGEKVHPKYLAAMREVCAAEDPGRVIRPPRSHEETETAVPSWPVPPYVARYLRHSVMNASSTLNIFHTVPENGLRRICTGFVDHFLFPTSFDSAIWLSQIQQAADLKRKIEAARTADIPRSGCIFWHMNDCWPVCSPATVDHEGHWKAAHYTDRRSFSPVFVVPRYDPQTQVIRLIAGVDGIKPLMGSVRWRVTDTAGAELLADSKKLTLRAITYETIAEIPVAAMLEKVGAERLVFWAEALDTHENVLARNCRIFCDWKALETESLRIGAEIRVWNDNGFAVTLTSEQPAFWVWLTVMGEEAWYDENFFFLEPGHPFRVRISPVRRMKLEDFRKKLRIRTIRDTFRLNAPVTVEP